MLDYCLQGGTVIWPLLLSSVATEAILSLAAHYGPARGQYPWGPPEADLEAMTCVIVSLVQGQRLGGAGLLQGEGRKGRRRLK
jgi:hypothetical protein